MSLVLRVPRLLFTTRQKSLFCLGLNQFLTISLYQQIKQSQISCIRASFLKFEGYSLFENMKASQCRTYNKGLLFFCVNFNKTADFSRGGIYQWRESSKFCTSHYVWPFYCFAIQCVMEGYNSPKKRKSQQGVLEALSLSFCASLPHTYSCCYCDTERRSRNPKHASMLLWQSGNTKTFDQGRLFKTGQKKVNRVVQCTLTTCQET